MKGKRKKVAYRLSPTSIRNHIPSDTENRSDCGDGGKKNKISDSVKQLLCHIASLMMKQVLAKLFTLIFCE